MSKNNNIAFEAREALEQLKTEFAKEFVINNPNAGISIQELIRLSKDHLQYNE